MLRLPLQNVLWKHTTTARVQRSLTTKYPSTIRSFSNAQSKAAPRAPFPQHHSQPPPPPPPPHQTQQQTLRQFYPETPKINEPQFITYEINYVKPVVFGVTVSMASFALAAWVYDRNQKSLWKYLKERQPDKAWWRSFRDKENNPTLADLWREKKAAMLEKKREFMERLNYRLQAMDLPRDVQRMCLIVAQKYVQMTDADKTMACLIGINLVVFGFWQVRSLKPFMNRWFLHHPGSPRSITLLTSCFSHQEVMHLGMNMLGLWSFGGILHDYLGREQFLALYLTMGVGANVASHIFSLAFRNSRPLMPSLGASGAIYGLLADTAFLYPHSSVSLIFLPFVPIKLGYALPALMSFDLAGILFKWRMFDHYAHLAGAGLGLGYTCWGNNYVWQPLTQKMKEIRA